MILKHLVHLVFSAGLQFDCFEFSSFIFYKQQHIFLYGQIKSSLTGDQLYNDHSPYSECSLI